MPSVLKSVGYKTITLGKAFWSENHEGEPLNLGFDVNMGAAFGAPEATTERRAMDWEPASSSRRTASNPSWMDVF